jgi:hypothetical protein
MGNHLHDGSGGRRSRRCGQPMEMRQVDGMGKWRETASGQRWSVNSVRASCGRSLQHLPRSGLVQSKRAVRPYPPDAAIPAAWPRVAHTSPNRPGRDHARELRSCSPLPVPRSPLAGVGLSLSSSGTGSLQIRPRVSRRHDHSGRRRTLGIVGRKQVSEPRSVLSTTRTTRRLRRWAAELALATPEVRAELL